MKGAITHVKISEGVMCPEQQDSEKTAGFCGSGIIDALACMLSLGMVDETGRITEEFISETPEGSECVNVCGISVTQRDIRNIQSAKAAVCAGMKTLLESENLSENDIDKVVIAGGFGSFIDVKNGEKIGMIPKGFSEKATAVGNASALGAIEILLSEKAMEESLEIGNNTEILELTANPVFSEKYIDEMMF